MNDLHSGDVLSWKCVVHMSYHHTGFTNSAIAYSNALNVLELGHHWAREGPPPTFATPTVLALGHTNQVYS